MKGFRKCFKTFLRSRFKEQVNYRALISTLRLSRCVEDGELKYLSEVKDLGRPERNTFTVSFRDIEEHSSRLANVIQENYYR